MKPHRVGLGWRPKLAPEILGNLDQIDVVEVIADDYFSAPKVDIRALRTLAAQVPVVLHGVSLGMASIAPVEPRRLDQMARLVNELEPEFWSEHLAFVRAGGVEIGHLAAPPRTGANIEGTLANLEQARRVVGTAPLVENIATLIDPPGSQMTEVEWLNGILSQTQNGMLLDLHNLYANAVNFDFDPVEALHQLPLERVRSIHLAGGRWISANKTRGRRLLDDHLHDVPEAVYALLTEVARRTCHPLTVLLERDGAFPPFTVLLEQLRQARQALRLGRNANLSEDS
ncbi:MAG: DUF692 domain-containing protein [Acidobacteria bacterium]|nr:DUF692 domain-containing protein [Acidobacteriota bacterium]